MKRYLRLSPRTLRYVASLCSIYFLTVFAVQAQTIRIDQFNQVSICAGTFTDDGGVDGDHSALSTDTITICSNSANSDETHIRLTFSQFEISGFMFLYNGDAAIPENLVNVLSAENNGTNPIFEASAGNASGCLTIVYQAGNMAPGWSALISCERACQPVVAELDSSDPPVMPVDTGYIDVCIGDPVTFNGLGVYPEDELFYDQDDATSTFEWSFDDGNNAVGTSVTHAFMEAGGYTVQLRITDVNGCQNNNQISQRVRVAPAPNFLVQNAIPEQICAGDTLNLTASTQFEPNPETQLFVTTPEQSFGASQVLADTTFLPDGSGVEYTTSLEFNNFLPGQVVTSINDIEAVCLNMEHSYAGDLDIWITCPNGQELFFVEFGSLGGQFVGEPIDQDNFLQGVGFDYCWTPDGEFTWVETVQMEGIGGGESIPAGDYATEQPYSNLIGCPLNGEWTINVRDNLSIDNGFIFNWGITFADALFPDLETFTVGFEEAFWEPADDFVFYRPDSITAVPTAAGDAHFLYNITDEFGCTYDTTVSVEVLPFSDPECYDCLPILDTNFQQANVISGAMVQTELASITSLDTLITFRTNPQTPFGREIYPSLGGAFTPEIEVNTIFPGGITDLNMQLESICVNIEKEAVGGIRLFVQAPDNTLLELSTGNGAGQGSDYLNTCFSPTAMTPITDAMPPFTGTFLPEGNFVNFDGVPINGTWRLLAWDLGTNEELGTFIDWSITFRHTIPVTYAWSPDNGTLSCTDCPDPVITADQNTTTYTVTATDSYGCTETGTVNINTNVDILLEMSGTDVTCNGENNGTATVVATGGIEPYTYLWSNEGNTATIEGLAPGTYIVTVTDANDNSAVDSITIAEPPAIVLSTTVVDVACFGELSGSIDLTIEGGTPPYTVAWNGEPSSEDLEGIPAGTYTGVVTDSNGCSEMIIVQVNEPTALELSAEITDVSCAGENTGSIDLTITGGVEPYTIAWSNDAETEDLTEIPAGEYSVTVTDGNGCTATLTATVGQPLDLEADVTIRAVDCSGDATGSIALEITGGTMPYTYLWSNEDTTATITDLPAGIYSGTVTDANGCMLATGDISITEPSALSCTVEILQEAANGDDGALTVAVEGGTAPYTLLWSNDATTDTITGLAPGVYSVTVTDANDCTTICTGSLEAFSMIGDRVFRDRSRDGIQDADEPGIAGVNVSITNADGSFTDNTVTDADGLYEFRVIAGSYRVTFANPGGLQASPINQGGDEALDSDIDENTLTTELITIGTEEVNLDVDAGFFDPCFPDLTFAGTIGEDQVLCGPGNVPDLLVQESPALGGVGTLNYLWLRTTGDPETTPINTWSPIPNSDSEDYQPGPLYETTYFVRCVRQDECPYIESNIVEVVVGDDANAEIAGPNLVCEFETVTFTALDFGPTADIDWDVEGPANITNTTANSIDVNWGSFGIFRVTLTVEDNGCTASRFLEVSVSPDQANCANSLNNPEEGIKVDGKPAGNFDPAGPLAQVLPNPAFAAAVQLQLLRDHKPGEMVTVQLMTATGQLIAAPVLESGRRTVDLTAFRGQPTGLYLVRVTQGETVETHRLIIR